MENIKDKQEIYNKFSLKTIKLDNLKNFINNYKIVHNDLWNEKTRKKWCTLRLKVYILKMRCLDQFSSQFVKRNKIMISYGSAKFSPTGSFEQSVPTFYVYKRYFNMYIYNYSN